MSAKINKKSEYITNLEKYHKKIEHHLLQNYGLKTTFLNVIGWGYTTMAYYIKTDQGEYVTRISAASKQKEQAIKKEIALSHELNKHLPTVTYLTTNGGNFITIFEDRILRVSTYID